MQDKIYQQHNKIKDKV